MYIYKHHRASWNLIGEKINWETAWNRMAALHTSAPRPAGTARGWVSVPGPRGVCPWSRVPSPGPGRPAPVLDTQPCTPGCPALVLGAHVPTFPGPGVPGKLTPGASQLLQAAVCFGVWKILGVLPALGGGGGGGHSG